MPWLSALFLTTIGNVAYAAILYELCSFQLRCISVLFIHLTHEYRHNHDIDNFDRLVRIKAEARRKREEREHAEHMRLMEKQRRTDALRKQFQEWNILHFPNARIELALVSL